MAKEKRKRSISTLEDDMLFMLQFLIGIKLMFTGWLIWQAGRKPALKAWLERTFLMPGDDLFARRRSYSGYVRWMRYVAFPAGLAIVVPTAIAIDVILGMAAAGIFWWMNTQKLKHDEELKKKGMEGK